MVQTTANETARNTKKASMTTAEKVRRQIKEGRKPKTMEAPSLFGAIKRMCDEADRARALMGKAGLNPDDIHLALVYRLNNESIGSSPLPPPGNIGPFIKKFEQMGKVDFLGIMWWQTTPDTRGKNAAKVSMWVTEFAEDDGRSASELLAYKNYLTAMKKPN